MAAPISRFVLLCATIAPGMALAQAPEKVPGWDAALARYDELISRKPFRHHLLGRDRLAQTRSVDALPMLAKDYHKPKDYVEFSRYTLATLLGRHFKKPEFTAALTALRQKHQKPVDTWLWYQTLLAEANAGGEANVAAIAKDSRNPLHRAAAIAAIGESSRGDLSKVILATCISFPKKEADRMVLLGAMTGALYAQRRRVNNEEYREALVAYISLLGDDVKLNHTAKVQMARHLQWILNGPAMFINEEPWLELLRRGEVKKPRANATRSAPRFFGIESEGERICYIVDMSDSMCKEISPSARPKGGPITGPRKKKKKKKGLVLDESDLPWNMIHTRWDLAREQLRISLSRLTPDKRFSIVWFGTDAGTLSATKGMVKASKTNIKAALNELDSVRLGPKLDGKAPDGQLRGKTNMHSGLRLAFGLAGRGVVDEYGYVHKGPLTEGCDTIFLMSDGAPSWDGFPMMDKDYGEDRVVVDVEYKKEAPRRTHLQYHGPYVNEDWLVADLRRMNAFRRIRIHCVGLGEANVQLLKRLAEIGRGEVFVVGQKR